MHPFVEVAAWLPNPNPIPNPNPSPQGRNHGIDIGGVQMWALPQIFFFKFSRGSDRKNKQARPSTNE